MSNEKTTNPLREGMRLKRLPQPNTLVIFGATGDLTHRKLLPSLFSLYKQNLLPINFSIIAFARRPKTSSEYQNEFKNALPSSGYSPEDKEKLNSFLQYIHYFQGDFSSPDAFIALSEKLKNIEKENRINANRLYYLATPPSAYNTIVENLGAAGLSANDSGWTRIIIEKPFGHDLSSAQDLNRNVKQVFSEEQIYRIDHYLGKETVQNILVFRFANGIFEPIWNRRYIDHVQISFAESIGVEGRGKFYEETGILRDIIQNHLLQLLCLVAMEPPSSFDADAVRDEKVKVLRAVQPISADDMDKRVVRAQYAAGSLLGQNYISYLDEEGVSPDSTTETYTAMKLSLNNWRWASVPFFIRAGKRLPKRVTEIAIHFKDAPLQIFGPQAADVSANVLTLNIQPNEGISLRFDSKVPGPTAHIRPVTMDFRYGTSFGEVPPDAYERLLLDAMIGDSTLFTRADENEMAWKIMTPILEHWQNLGKTSIPQYKIGTWGPEEADVLLSDIHNKWRQL